MQNTKTVLFLSNHFITLYAFRRELIERLVGLGHRVVLSMPADDQNVFFRDMGCEIVETAMSRRGLNPAEDMKLLANYRRIMKAALFPEMLFILKNADLGRCGSRIDNQQPVHCFHFCTPSA